MADLTSQERLQPCLLDRLTDEDPYSKEEPRSRRVMSLAGIRQAVTRDLARLLNSHSRPSFDGLEDYPELERTVLNYGIPDVCGTAESGSTPDRIRQMLLRAIRAFEPRIIPGTLDVQPVVEEGEHRRISLVFEVTCQIWAQPLPESLYLKTEVDLETGQCEIDKS